LTLKNTSFYGLALALPFISYSRRHICVTAFGCFDEYETTLDGWLLCPTDVIRLVFPSRVSSTDEIPTIEEQQQEQNNKEQNSAIVAKKVTAPSFRHFRGLLSTR
jgi:hypothetical protein